MHFANPAMLWALLALAVPVLVHLLNFRRYRKVYFSDVSRLEEIQQESRRRTTVRQWLILAMRLLAVAALVLAFARPVLPVGPQAAVTSGSTAVSIFVDNSYSMASATAEGDLLEAAKNRAREVAAAYGPSDRFQLLTAEMGGAEMQWFSRDEVLDAIDAVALSPVTRNLSGVVLRQRSFLARSGADNLEAYVISDFQQSVSDLDRLQPDSTVRLSLVALPSAEGANIAVDTVVFDAPAYYAGARVVASVRVVGTTGVESLPVRLYVNGHERALATVDIPDGGGSVAVDMPFTLDATSVEGYVEVVDHPVTFDDRYYFTLGLSRGARLLVVGDGNANLRRLFDGDSLVTYATASRLDISTLSDHSAILLDGLRSLSSGEAQALRQWVDEGGTLVVVPSADDRLSPLDELLGLPRLEAWTDQPVRASHIDYESPLFRGVFAARTDDLELPTLHGRWRLAAATARAARSVIGLADGTDFLTATPCGSGTVYLFACPLDAANTDFVGQALFVPVLYNIALHSQPVAVSAHRLGDESPFAVDADPAAGLMLTADGFAAMPDLRRVGGRTLLFPHGEVRRAGVYALGDTRLAFNYDRRESDLRCLSADEVSRLAPSATLLTAGARSVADQLRQAREGRQLWRGCLLLALLALLVETLLLLAPSARRPQHK